MIKSSALFYATLFVYPVITLVTPDLSYLGWLLKTGGGLPPHDVRQRAARNQGNLLIFKFIFLLAACWILMEQVPISAESIGLRRNQPTGTLIMLAVAAALQLWWFRSMRSLALRSSLQTGNQHFLLQQSRVKLLVILVLGGFAEEFWRGLTLTILPQAGVSALSAVLITSVVFGVGHLFSFKSIGAAIGRVLAPTIGGALLATLFLWTQTLIIPFIVHVLVNSLGANLGLKRLIAKQTAGTPCSKENAL